MNYYTIGTPVRSTTGKALGMVNYTQKGQKGKVEDVSIVDEPEGARVMLFVRFGERLVAVRLDEVTSDVQI